MHHAARFDPKTRGRWRAANTRHFMMEISEPHQSHMHLVKNAVTTPAPLQEYSHVHLVELKIGVPLRSVTSRSTNRGARLQLVMDTYAAWYQCKRSSPP